MTTARLCLMAWSIFLIVLTCSFSGCAQSGNQPATQAGRVSIEGAVIHPHSYTGLDLEQEASAVQTIRSVVERSDGQFLVHGGSTEHRRGMLGSLVSAADMVVFPVDCVDHDSVGTLKRECERNQITYHPLRTSSAAACIGLLTHLAKAQESTLPSS